MVLLRRFSGLVYCALLAVSALATPVLQDAANVTIAGVVYQGVLSEDGKVQAYLGVPFAQPPTGDLRWVAPQPIKSGSGAYSAVNFAAACAQSPHMVNWYRGVVSSFGGDADAFPVPEFSEDCLYLNVWAPVQSAAGQLPVMVYIHGGSNAGGWSFEPNYHGEQLARQGVIVVTLAYRVGILGFFSHPQLKESNFGLLDQAAGLRWVQNNIQQFGGDSQRVTVVGESSGANNITHLLVSPQGRGLFQRVIHQSAGWAVHSRVTRDQRLKFGQKLSNAADGDSADGIDALRQLTAKRLIQLAQQQLPDYEYDPVAGVVSLPAPVPDLLAAGEFDAVDLVIGSNADEWLMYLDDKVSLEEWMQSRLTNEQRAAARLLPESSVDERRQVDALETAQNYVCPSLELARMVEKKGGSSWVYYFTRQRTGTLAAQMGAYHGAELPYVFNTHDSWLPTVKEDRELTELMMGYWSDFAGAGDPNLDGRPNWPRYGHAREVLALNSPTRVLLQHPSVRICEALQQ